MNLHTIYIYGNWIVNVYERVRTRTIENDGSKSQRLQLTFPVLYGLIRTSDTVTVSATIVVSGECLRYRFTMVEIHRNSSFTIGADRPWLHFCNKNSCIRTIGLGFAGYRKTAKSILTNGSFLEMLFRLILPGAA